MRLSRLGAGVFAGFFGAIPAFADVLVDGQVRQPHPWSLVDPEFEGKSALLAYQRDGRDLETPQLVVPGDKHGARYVHDVVHIEVR